jgi:alkylation response protein AidB-like acyl-CoA dehydrogenase
MMWPKEFGGRGLGPLSQAVILSELVKANVPAGMNWAGLEIGGPAIFLYGSEEQKKRFLPPILTAEELWCQLYSEPNAGSDLASLRTKAVDMGDHFLVNGQKTWTSDGLHAD